MSNRSKYSFKAGLNHCSIAAAFFISLPTQAAEFIQPLDMESVDTDAIFSWQGGWTDWSSMHIYAKPVCESQLLRPQETCSPWGKTHQLSNHQIENQLIDSPYDSRNILSTMRGRLADFYIIACNSDFPIGSDAPPNINPEVDAHCSKSDPIRLFISPAAPQINLHPWNANTLPLNGASLESGVYLRFYTPPSVGRPTHYRMELTGPNGFAGSHRFPAFDHSDSTPDGTGSYEYSATRGTVFYEQGAYTYVSYETLPLSNGDQVTWFISPCIDMQYFNPTCQDTPENCEVLTQEVCGEPAYDFGAHEAADYLQDLHYRQFTVSGEPSLPPSPDLGQDPPSNPDNFGRTIAATFLSDRCQNCHMVNIDSTAFESTHYPGLWGPENAAKRSDPSECQNCHGDEMLTIVQTGGQTSGLQSPLHALDGSEAAPDWMAPPADNKASTSAVLFGEAIDGTAADIPLAIQAGCEEMVEGLQEIANTNGITLTEAAHHHFHDDPRVIWAVHSDTVIAGSNLKSGAVPQNVTDWLALADRWIEGGMDCSVDGWTMSISSEPIPQERVVDNLIPPVLDVYPQTGTFPDTMAVPVVLNCTDPGSASEQHPNGPRCGGIAYLVHDGPPMSSPPDPATFDAYVAPLRIGGLAGEQKTLYYMAYDNSGNTTLVDHEVYSFEEGDSQPPSAEAYIVYDPEEPAGRQYALRFSCMDNASPCDIYYRRNGVPSTQTDVPWSQRTTGGPFLNEAVSSEFHYQYFAVDTAGNPTLSNLYRPEDASLIESQVFEVAQFTETNPPTMTSTREGDYEYPFEITLDCEDDRHNCVIRYTMTTDGTEPDDPSLNNGELWERPISVTEPGSHIVIQALAVDTSLQLNTSEVIRLEYQLYPEEDCSDGVDNNEDTLVDCDDRDCLDDEDCIEDVPEPEDTPEPEDEPELDDSAYYDADTGEQDSKDSQDGCGGCASTRNASSGVQLFLPFVLFGAVIRRRQHQKPQ